MAQQQPAFEGQTPWGIYVEGGSTLEGNSKSNVFSGGVTYRFGPRHELWGGVVTTYGDFFVSNWQAPRRFSSDQAYTQVGTIANARYRFDRGVSPWFADIGVGLTWFDGKYETEDRRFSTQFQFTEVLGIGRSFGATGAHELQLRMQHVSERQHQEAQPRRKPRQGALRLPFLRAGRAAEAAVGGVSWKSVAAVFPARPRRRNRVRPASWHSLPLPGRPPWRLRAAPSNRRRDRSAPRRSARCSTAAARAAR